MPRKTPLKRYQLEKVSRANLLKGAWLGTPADFRINLNGVKRVLWQHGLAPLTTLPHEELVRRYHRYARQKLQAGAKGSDLHLFEQNPDDPENEILFADEVILFTTRLGWCIGYIQPANFNEKEVLEARKYAQVVAILNPKAPASDLVRLLNSTSTYKDWLALERSGAVDRSHNLVEIYYTNPDGSKTTYREH